jgi:galactoside O-acetyltransferase
MEAGDYLHIGPYVSVIGGAGALLRIGHFCNIAAGSRIVCGSDAFHGDGLVGSAAIPESYRDTIIRKPVTLERFANVASNVVLVPGVTLAEGCVVGACSLVLRSTDPWTIYAGVPARPIGTRPRDKMIGYARELGYE